MRHEGHVKFRCWCTSPNTGVSLSCSEHLAFVELERIEESASFKDDSSKHRKQARR